VSHRPCSGKACEPAMIKAWHGQMDYNLVPEELEQCVGKERIIGKEERILG